ncbi:MAG: glycosyltransferase [Paludibacteraceae bacterium]|nr:glycosyltransferase [Paludibacteraceae bacterium]MBR5971578.1 glycosyltransferase [Paludibacteraceae bacterium]
MKVSIITATFNSASTIRMTIESVARQTHNDIEHLIIDGGSQDNTVEIAKEYPSVSYIISEPDNGLYEAINKGIRAAKGDIIGILNSDDFFASDTIIETIVNQFSSTETEAIYGDVCYITHDKPFLPIRYYSSKSFNPWKMKFGFIPAHPTFYMKREKFQEIGLYNESYKIASDFEFLLRCFCIHKIKYQYIPQTMVYMRIGGISNKNFASHKTIFAEHKKALKENNIYSNSLFLCLRYPIKIFEVVIFRITKLFKGKKEQEIHVD